MSAGTIDEIVAFWFETLKPEDWYRKNPAIDAAITERFSATYEALKTGVPPEWLAEPKGMLAAIIVLDQFLASLPLINSTNTHFPELA
jgi:uncharacterized protein (DUF924 family)